MYVMYDISMYVMYDILDRYVCHTFITLEIKHMVQFQV